MRRTWLSVSPFAEHGVNKLRKRIHFPSRLDNSIDGALMVRLRHFIFPEIGSPGVAFLALLNS